MLVPIHVINSPMSLAKVLYNLNIEKDKEKVEKEETSCLKKMKVNGVFKGFDVVDRFEDDGS